MPDPLDDARQLLALCRLLYRYRRRVGGLGVIGATEAAEDLVPIGQRMVEAIAAAKSAPTPEARREALALVAQAGGDLGAAVVEEAEGIGGLLGVLLAGVREERDPRLGR